MVICELCPSEPDWVCPHETIRNNPEPPLILTSKEWKTLSAVLARAHYATL